MMVLDSVASHNHANLFNTPIRAQDAPDYHQIVYHPTDLKAIRLKIRDGTVFTFAQLKRELSLMFANSLMYSRPGTPIYRMASEMRAAAEQVLLRFEMTQSDHW